MASKGVMVARSANFTPSVTLRYSCGEMLSRVQPKLWKAYPTVAIRAAVLQLGGPEEVASRLAAIFGGQLAPVVLSDEDGLRVVSPQSRELFVLVRGNLHYFPTPGPRRLWRCGGKCISTSAEKT